MTHPLAHLAIMVHLIYFMKYYWNRGMQCCRWWKSILYTFNSYLRKRVAQLYTKWC